MLLTLGTKNVNTTLYQPMVIYMITFCFSRSSMDWFHSVWCKLPFRPSSEQFVSKIQLSPRSCSGWSHCSLWFFDDVICQ